jgi:hypothetical protein
MTNQIDRIKYQTRWPSRQVKPSSLASFNRGEVFLNDANRTIEADSGFQ